VHFAVRSHRLQQAESGDLAVDHRGDARMQAVAVSEAGANARELLIQGVDDL
jgi:hypothetical protein